jgi:hypothetical protein
VDFTVTACPSSVGGCGRVSCTNCRVKSHPTLQRWYNYLTGTAITGNLHTDEEGPSLGTTEVGVEIWGLDVSQDIDWGKGAQDTSINAIGSGWVVVPGDQKNSLGYPGHFYQCQTAFQVQIRYQIETDETQSVTLADCYCNGDTWQVDSRPEAGIDPGTRSVKLETPYSTQVNTTCP